VSVRFNALIDALAARCRGPVFSSHITLIGGLEGTGDDLSRLASGLAAEVPAFDVKLNTLDTGDSFYQCVFLRAEISDALIKARQLADEVFASCLKEEGRAPRDPFVPHLSLVYGDLDDAQKQDLTAGLEAALATTYKADTISLWQTTGPPSAWRRVGGPYELKGKQDQKE